MAVRVDTFSRCCQNSAIFGRRSCFILCARWLMIAMSWKYNINLRSVYSRWTTSRNTGHFPAFPFPIPLIYACKLSAARESVHVYSGFFSWHETFFWCNLVGGGGGCLVPPYTNCIHPHLLFHFISFVFANKQHLQFAPALALFPAFPFASCHTFSLH